MTARNITLKSCDEQSFAVDLAVAKMFDYLPIQMRLEGHSEFKLVLDNPNPNNENNGLEIPLNFVTSAVLKKVLEWAEHEVQKEKNGKGEDAIINKVTGLTQWEEKYLADGLKGMFDVVKAANSLGVRSLLDLHFKFVHNWIRGRLHIDVPDILMYQVGRFLKSSWPHYALTHRRRI